MLLNNVLSWGGCVLLLYGLQLIGNKKLSGFYVALVAEVMWIAWAFSTHTYALAVMSLWIMVMYVRAIWLWRKDVP